MMGKESASDPYVVVYDGRGKKVGKSKVIKDDLNPTWDYDCKILL